MRNSNRVKLHGTYRTPRFRYGVKVTCALRGQIEIIGLSDARIPWPIGKRARWRLLVLFGELARAVRRESNVANLLLVRRSPRDCLEVAEGAPRQRARSLGFAARDYDFEKHPHPPPCSSRHS
jgi:hypothetical protein